MTAEPAIDPKMKVIDSHHHLYDRPELKYLLQEYLRDADSGHNVIASVYIQARSMLRIAGPEEFKPVGEVEFANGMAAMSASGTYGPVRACSSIIGFADLSLGSAIKPTLDRLALAGGGRLRGIRHTLCWDKNAQLLTSSYNTSESMMESAEFRAGFSELAKLDLIFEAWAFFHQLQRVARLAQDFPDTKIVVNHLGGVLRTCEYRDDPKVFDVWRKGIASLAACQNVTLKISGLGMRIGGFRFEEREMAPSSHDLADAWRPWVDYAVSAFGPKRCMFGSNFPVDKGSYSFSVGLNAIKRLFLHLPRVDQEYIFWRTASNVYEISLD